VFRRKKLGAFEFLWKPVDAFTARREDRILKGVSFSDLGGD